MIPVFWFLVALLQALQVSAEVDRDRVTVGDAVTYTVRALVTPGQPVQITLPPFDGFTLIGRSDHRESVLGQNQVEAYVVELRLRAQRAGFWRLGPLRVGEGVNQGVSPEVEIAVEGAGGGPAAPQLGPRVMQLLQRARPPRPGEVGISLVVSADTVMVGEQVDIVTVAWFPRELLARLRRPPTIRPPAVDGVYSAVQPSAAGVAASREVGGVAYDLYVAHQIVFPVDEGTVAIPAAELAFSLPTGRQYFSDEKAYQYSSDARKLVVQPLPGGGPGPLARDLSLAWELRPEPARAGEPIPVDLVLAGNGNTALWRAPVVRWPEGSRGYADAPVDEPRVTAGVVGGSRRYRFSVIADSAGTLVLPDVWYRYYDPSRGTWREALARSVVLPVQPPAPVTRPRSVVPPLDEEPWSITGLSPALVVLVTLLLLGPPLAWVGTEWWRRRGAAPAPTSPGGAVERLERAVRALVPDPEARREERLALALREAGLGVALSEDAAKVYHALATGRFDPAHPEAPNRLEAEALRVLKAWPRRIARAVATAVLLAAVLTPAAWASAAPEAPDSAVERSVRGWYGLGAGAFASGQEARAAAAWLTAHRLAPRNALVGDAWHRVALLSADLQRVGRGLPFTPAELMLIGALCWACGWAALILRRRRTAGILLTASVAVMAVGTLLGRNYARPIAVVARSAVLRQAPHGLAEELGRADELSIVDVVATRPGWRRVRTEGGTEGWVPDGALAEVRGLDFP